MKLQNEQLGLVNVSLGSEVGKLKKQLEQVRSEQHGGGQLVSLQEELEKSKEQLQEASALRKKMEEEHSMEKQELEQVREPVVLIHPLKETENVTLINSEGILKVY